MKDKKTIILAVVLLALVGVYVWYSQKVEKENRPTGKKVDITRVDPNFALRAKVAKAVRKHIDEKGAAPRTLDELKGKYLDEATLKLASSKNLQYIYNGPNSYRIRIPLTSASATLAGKTTGGKTQPTGTTSSSGSASTAGGSTPIVATTGWKYDPTGKPDPFKPFILARVEEEFAPKVIRRQLTPLQKMPLSEIQSGLKAIVWGQLGNKALVEDATGKGYVVQEGTYVGQHDGIVKKIYEDRIIVEEYRRDPAKGQLEPNEVVLKLKKVEAEE